MEMMTFGIRNVLMLDGLIESFVADEKLIGAFEMIAGRGEVEFKELR
jgi:hypothetical protein